MKVKVMAASIGAAGMLVSGLGVTTAASAAATHPVASATGLPIAYTGGWGHARVRSGGIGFRDAGLMHLRWSQWSSTTAHGTGRFSTGVPGHMVNDAAWVTLSNVNTTHKGTRCYASMKVGLYKHGRWVGKFRAIVRNGYWDFI